MTRDRSPLVSVPDEPLRRAILERRGDLEVIEWDLFSAAPRDHIDLVVTSYLSDGAELAHLAGVSTRLVQSQSIGYEGVAARLPPGHVFANAAGVHEASTAEMAIALVLASLRGIADFARAGAGATSERVLRVSLADRRVLLVGYGGVGRAIDARLAPFETTVTRVARHARTDERGEIFGVESLPALLPDAEVVIVAVPLSEETRGLVNDRFLSFMGDGRLLANLARGAVADTAALVTHASTGRLNFALDVTDPEPLPAGHALLTLPNVLITPHVAGATTAMLPRMVSLIIDQVARLEHDERPRNVVLES